MMQQEPKFLHAAESVESVRRPWWAFWRPRRSSKYFVLIVSTEPRIPGQYITIGGDQENPGDQFRIVDSAEYGYVPDDEVIPLHGLRDEEEDFLNSGDTDIFGHNSN